MSKEEIINGYKILGFKYIHSDNRQHYYDVQCVACGAIKCSTLSNIRKSKGCTRCRKSNVVGKKYNMLTILKKTRIEGHNTFVQYQCECGKIDETSISNLVSGRQKSCGCIRFKKVKEEFALRDKIKEHSSEINEYLNESNYKKSNIVGY